MRNRHLQRFIEILNLPTAPFVEGQVMDYIRRFVAERRELHARADAFGNLHVQYTPRRRMRLARGGRPILFAAHTDHPGFIAGRMLTEDRVEAEWRGGVQARFFLGARVKFRVDNGWIGGTVEKVIPQRAKKGSRPSTASRTPVTQMPPKGAVIRVRRAIPSGSLGMWDLRDAALRGRLVEGRACDDLAGVAAILCALEEVVERASPVPCHACFTRAEEVGFAGALAAVEAGKIPRRALIVAVECSRAIPGVEVGAGPVLRVGDKMSVFTPALLGYGQAVAENLVKEDKTFAFQRKLMDGGSCEATAYGYHGYDAMCICLPLLNYHNMDTAHNRIAPEAVGSDDYLNLVKWFVALAESPAKMPYESRSPALGQRLATILKQHRARLLKTATRAISKSRPGGMFSGRAWFGL